VPLNKPALRVIVADDNAAMRKYYKAILPALGHNVVAALDTGADLVRACKESEVDVVVTDIKMPDMEGVQAVHLIYDFKPLPVVLVSGVYDPHVFEKAVAGFIVGYIEKPVTQSSLCSQIEEVMTNYREFEILIQESTNCRQALRDRKVVERAKSLLRSRLSEGEAFAQLQAMARQHDCKIAAAAQIVVAACEASP